MSNPLPSLSAAAVDANGRFSTAWVGFFSRFSAAPAAIQAVTVGGSPFSYTAPSDGTLGVVGGTVSSVTLTRGRVTIAMPAGVIPVAQGDVVAVAYTAAPTISFIPRTA